MRGPGVARLRTKVLRRLSRGTSWHPFLTVEAGVGAGLQIRLRNASDDYSVGTNEIPVQEAVRDHVRPGGVFYDVGSNIGFFALVAARLVGPAGFVHAFEPVPANVACIEDNVARNQLRNVTAWPVAVGPADGVATLHLARHPGGATIAESDLLDPAGSMEVQVVSIDSLVADGRLQPPTFVKIDVEGAEPEVLAGMRDTIVTHRPTLLVEVDGADAPSVQVKVERIDELVRALGYSPRPLDVSYAEADWQVRHLLAVPGS